MGLWAFKLLPENANFKAVGNTASDFFCKSKLPSMPTHAIELNKKCTHGHPHWRKTGEHIWTNPYLQKMHVFSVGSEKINQLCIQSILGPSATRKIKQQPSLLYGGCREKNNLTYNLRLLCTKEVVHIKWLQINKGIVISCFRILSMHWCKSICNSLQISSPQSKYKQLP